MKYWLCAMLVAITAGCGARASLPAASPLDVRTFSQSSGPRYLHEYTLPLGTYPSSIVNGPDGALWFSTYPYFTNHQAINLGVGRITVQGRQHYYLFESGFYDMVVGANGRMWWTNPYQRPYSVGYVTTTGAFTQFAGNDGGGDPESITADSSGNPWFVNFGATRDVIELSQTGQRLKQFAIPWAVRVGWGAGNQLWLDQIATPHSWLGYFHGGFHRRQIPGADYIPGYIVPGPDGRMWSCNGSRLLAVTPSLNFSVYNLPPNHGCAGLVTGPDGNVWTADFEGSSLIRVTPTGSITMYPTPTANMIPDAICVGPDGNLWFTEIQQTTDVSKIGVLKP